MFHKWKTDVSICHFSRQGMRINRNMSKYRATCEYTRAYHFSLYYKERIPVIVKVINIQMQSSFPHIYVYFTLVLECNSMSQLSNAHVTRKVNKRNEFDTFASRIKQNIKNYTRNTKKH